MSHAASSTAHKPQHAASSTAPKPQHHLPKFVYRGDNRPPSEIFKEGFHPHGSGDDLLAHIQGGENLLKSGYISTSQSLRIPAAFLSAVFEDGHEDAYVDPKDPLTKYNRRRGWIYYINTSGLEPHMEFVPDLLPEKQRDKYGYQQEWAIKGSIPGHNIQLAHHVDGYIKRYSDPGNMKQGVDPIFPPDKPSPYKEKVDNPGYAFKSSSH